jgi:phosphatidylglycerol:prolipoprotein diacylglycerol transferase
MHPILYSFGPVTVYTYGFFVSMGFLASFALFLFQLKKRQISVDTGIDLAFWVLLSSIVGSRLVYVLVNLNYYLHYPFKVFMLWEGGLVWYGAFIGALVAALIYFRAKKLDGWVWLDIAIPFVALGQGIGRIGCLMAGCCYGKPTNLPWGITFTASEIAPLGVSLHPTQIYDMLFDLTIFAVLFLRRDKVRFRGEQILSYLFLYGATRSIVEVFRGDPRGSLFWGSITTSQLISIIAVIVGIVLYYRIREKNRIDLVDGMRESGRRPMDGALDKDSTGHRTTHKGSKTPRR